jgi:hypothetical protein
MRTSVILIFLSITAIIGCKGTSHGDTVSGTFIIQTKSEYSIALDTLIIVPLSQAENSFQIERRTGYQKIRNGIAQPKEYKVEKGQSVWNEGKQVLSETDYGRQITPSKDGQFLFLKNTRYQKIR